MGALYDLCSYCSFGYCIAVVVVEKVWQQNGIKQEQLMELRLVLAKLLLDFEITFSKSNLIVALRNVILSS